MPMCSYDKCAHPYAPRLLNGLCPACYQHRWKCGTLDRAAFVQPICERPSCDKPAISHGLCDKHRKRLARHGDIEAGWPEERGAKGRHPLYQPWLSMRRQAVGNMDERWADFWNFVEDVGARPARSRLYRSRRGEPYGPGNFEWIEPVLSGQKLADQAAYQRAYRVKRGKVLSRLSRRKLYGITTGTNAH